MTTALDDPWVAEAVRRASQDFDSQIANRKIDLVGKSKSVLKFGRNINMSSGVISTIWDTGVANETYLPMTEAGNLIDRISSSAVADTEVMRVEGHYATADNVCHFVILNVTLNGRTPVDLATATVLVDEFGAFGDYNKLCRNSRLANIAAGTALVGDVYIYQSGQTVTNGVPQDLTLTHGKVRGTDGLNQSNKCANTVSNEDIFILTSCRVGVARASAAFVDYSVELARRPNVFREVTIGVSSRDSGFVPIFGLPPYIVIPPNTDIRVRGSASTNSVVGVAEFSGLLARLS